MFDRYRAAHPDLGGRTRPAADRTSCPTAGTPTSRSSRPTRRALASRDSGGKVLNAIVARVPWLIGGSADLAPSTKTDIKGAAVVRGRTITAAATSTSACANMAWARSSTAWRCRTCAPTAPPSSSSSTTCARRSGCRRSWSCGAVWVFTHDSIGVGEDGPTHQPIEHLATLRAIPGLDTIRPGDANEVACGVARGAGATRARPTALVLSRQALPTLDRDEYAQRRGRAEGRLRARRLRRRRPR